MKELKILIRQLNQYPSNLFAIPTIDTDGKHVPPHAPIHGLSIIDMKGETIGFINLGTNDGEVTLD